MSLLEVEKEYRKRLSEHEAILTSAMRSDENLGNARLLIFWSAVVFLILSMHFHLVHIAWISLFIVAFLGSLVAHANIAARLERAKHAVAYYVRALDRIAGRWEGKGKTGDAFADPRHPYALDLDLFGKGSLFERICTAQTTAGEKTLAGWFLTATSPVMLARRQAAIVELREKLDWREEIALSTGEMEKSISVDELIGWAEEPAFNHHPLAPFVGLGITLFMVVSVVAFIFTDSGVYFLSAAVVIQLIFAGKYRRKVDECLSNIQMPSRYLKDLSQIIEKLEREPWQAQFLVDLRKLLEVEGLLPSAQIRRLTLLIDWLDSRRNQFFALFAVCLMWGTHFAFLLERWRSRCGRSVRRWLDAVGEIEAINSLSSYAFENPEDVFPELVEGRTVFEARSLGHPLLSNSVRNDVLLGGDVQLLLISGSNMSGKSTLLRAIGTNAVLALAGAPVRAVSLTISPLAVGSTLRIQDSLREGTSRFFAELLRVQQIIKATEGKVPVLFLLDELLHGTNSHDRLIGSEAILRTLLDRGGIGAVTTHDLSLSKIVDEFREKRARNVHFEDHFENGRMVFDYKMRDGVIAKSNALELIKSLGIPIS
jgi:hypothetical protein